jgi:hypothetical protein
MAYYIDLFSPETYEAFSRSPRDISGFRPRHKNTADKIKPGDIFVCYLTRLGRWFGLLEVIEGPFIDNKPIFAAESENDPFVVRFRVKPVVWLSREMGISIHEEEIWSGLASPSPANCTRTPSVGQEKFAEVWSVLMTKTAHFSPKN